MNLKLLLIEDTQADATLFCDQVQGSLGEDVDIDWVTQLSEAFNRLETGQIYDQIWLDPALPDLRDSNLGKALATLKKYVSSGELRLLGGSGFTSTHKKQAIEQNVQVVEDINSRQVLALVQELLSKKTGGTATIRVEQAKLEGAIARAEMRIDENSSRLAKIEAICDRLQTLQFELGATREAIGIIPQLRDDVLALKRVLEIKRADQAGVWEFRKVVVPALISAMVAIATLIIPVVLPKLLEPPVNAQPK